MYSYNERVGLYCYTKHHSRVCSALCFWTKQKINEDEAAGGKEAERII
jgi:hypothetical protein